MTKYFTRCLPSLLLVLALPLVAQASDGNAAAARQVETATAHAGMAMGAADLKMTHAHLHHVLNCLVGPTGNGFDAAAANPCKGMGQGAIVDAKGDAESEARLQAAVDEAEKGVKTTTLATAHAEAEKVMNTLQGN